MAGLPEARLIRLLRANRLETAKNDTGLVSSSCFRAHNLQRMAWILWRKPSEYRVKWYRVSGDWPEAAYSCSAPLIPFVTTIAPFGFQSIANSGQRLSNSSAARPYLEEDRSNFISVKNGLSLKFLYNDPAGRTQGVPADAKAAWQEANYHAAGMPAGHKTQVDRKNAADYALAWIDAFLLSGSLLSHNQDQSGVFKAGLKNRPF